MAIRKVFFNEYSDLVQDKFKDSKDFHTFGRICIDTYKNKLQKYTKEEANEVIRNKIKEVAGLPENPTELQIKRAFKKSAVREALFEILEETLDDTLITGWTNDPFFNRYVEFKSMVLGDKNSFYIKNDCVVTVAKIAPGHHNLERQRLAGGSTRSVSTASYGAKVYMEMSRFIQGVEDWNELIDAIALAFTRYVNTMVHDAVMSAVDTLPVPSKWHVKGLANATNKKKFKQLISDVRMATGSNVVIMGTEVALGELANFGDPTWISNEAKDDVYRTGRIGTFEGIPIVEIPQAFAYNDVENYLEADDKLLIMPNNIDRFIKFFYEGADEIVENSEIAANGDDTKDYEFKTTFGLETMTNVRFGLWELVSA